MVRITISDESDIPIVDFGGENFDKIRTLLKSKGFTYLPEVKAWTAHSYKVLSTITDLQDIEDVEINNSTHEQLKEKASSLSGIRKYRNKFDRSLLKVEPIKGKAPNEDFQLHDIKSLITSNRKGLFLTMGLGKTMITVSAINQYFYRGDVQKVLVVTPSEGVVNWTREIQKFSDLFPAERVSIADRENRKPFTEDHDIVIMTYRTFLMISDDYYKQKNPKGKAKKYRKPTIPFDQWGEDGKRMIVLDESHNIKNLQSRQTHALHLHKDYFEYRYLLTGTPADKVEHYYSQMRFLDEDLIPEGYHEWLQGMANIGDRFSQYNINYFYPDAVEQFTERIAPYVIRRNSEDHIELPENYIDKVYVRLSDLQKSIYEAIINDTISSLEDKKGILLTKDMVNRFPFLTLALDNPAILREGKMSDQLSKLLDKWKFSKHNKLPVTQSLVDKYLDQGKKVILWTGHPRTVEDLMEHFQKKKPYGIHGQMDFQNKTRNRFRDEMVEDFKRSKDRNLFIASYKVLNSAVNLVEASRNIYFDRSYSLTEWLQSQKRTHRIGQEDRVITHPIIFEETLDVRLDAKLENKEDIDKHLLSRNRLTVDEWRQIFLGDLTM